MDTYHILAWLPGTYSFVARDGQNNVGLLARGQFEHKGPWFMDAATIKWGFRPVKIENPMTVDQAMDMASELNSKL